MTENLSIQAVGVNEPQQTKKSATPYALTGALAGAGAGYAGAYYTSPKPKYESLDDIVKEANDKFESSLKEVTEDKTIQDKAKEARNKVANADAEYDRLWENFKNENAAGEPIKDENYKNLEKELADKKAAVEAKRAELEKAGTTVTDDMLKTELEAQNAAQKTLDEAKAKLPKAEPKTEEALKKNI